MYGWIPFCWEAWADVIHRTSGETTKGLVVEEHWDRIVVSTEQGEQTIFRKDVNEIFYSDPERNYLHLGNMAMAEGELWLAETFFRKALAIHPRWVEAEDALGRLKDLFQKKQAPGRWSAYGSLPIEEALQRSVGITLKADEPYPEVSRVEVGSAADIAGIRVGDKLVAYWGYSLGFLPIDRVAFHLDGPQGSVLKITLERSVHLTQAAIPSFGKPGVELDMEPLGLTVRSVPSFLGTTPIGLMPGDRLVRMNGQSTRYMPLRQARSKLAGMGPHGMSVVIHRDVVLERR